jgi:hypothetical protein
MLGSLFFTDETTFHSSEYINSQKSRIISAETPHALRKIPLHSSKIGAWCTVSRKLNLGPLLFEETITDENYPISFSQIVALLKKRTNWIVAFNKMGRDLLLNNNNSFLVRLLRWSHLSGEVFGRHDPRTLSHMTSFFLWGFLKGAVCSNKLTSVGSLHLPFKGCCLQ